ncbi:MAG TPA: hypothetical protein VM784_06565, partial [Actinomycetota bacterium]|nr:hypothetical protein [Actinomycetota bacterium]
MRKLFTGLLASLVVAALAPVARTDVSKLVLVHAYPRGESEAAYLMSNFDETHNHAPGRIELLLWPGDRADLDATAIDYDIIVDDVVARDRALSDGETRTFALPGPDRSDYRRLADYESEMKTLADK